MIFYEESKKYNINKERIIIKGEIDMRLEGKNGYGIDVKTFIPDECENIIIACHGFGGDKESSAITLLADKIKADKIGVITFDFAGHGKSEVEGDKLTLDNCISDLEAIEEYARKEFPNAKIGVFATSFGAYITLLKINKNGHKYNSIILRAPAICMDEILKNAILVENVEEYKEKGYAILGYDREMKVPYKYYEELLNNKLFDIYNANEEMLAIQGTEDDMAPIKDTIRFIEEKNTKANLIKIEGADHRMKKDGELDKAINFAREYIIKCMKK